MEVKIKEVNAKLLRTFQRLNYKVNYDDSADEIIKLNSLVGHVYRLFVHRELKTTTSLSTRLQGESASSQLNQNEYIIVRCCDKITELVQVFLMLLKLVTKGNEKALRSCLAQLQTIIEEIQSTFILYQGKQKNTKFKISQLKNISLKSSISINDIPIQIVKSNPIKEETYIQIKQPHTYEIVQDLKEQIETLNQALIENNKQYNFQLQICSEKLHHLQQSINRLSVENFHLLKNEKYYQNQINQLKNDKIQDNLLIKSLARKIRKLEDSSYGQFSSKASTRYMCPRLEKQMENSRKSRGSRPVSIESGYRMPSRKNIRLQTMY